jgi:hypothetical protein
MTSSTTVTVAPTGHVTIETSAGVAHARERQEAQR